MTVAASAPPGKITIHCVDLETTGESAEKGHTVIEIGETPVVLRSREPADPGADGPTYDTEIGAARSVLCRPGRAIPYDAAGVHNILQADIPADALLFRPALAGFGFDRATLETPFGLFAAHNAGFERQWLTEDALGMPARWICTYRCSYTLFPDLESYGLRSVLYEMIDLGLIDVSVRAHCLPAHRAGPDSYACAAIVAVLAREAPIRDLVRMSSEPMFLRSLPFGKHSGEPIEQVPVSYLEWLLDQGPGKFNEDTIYTALQLARRKGGRIPSKYDRRN